MAMSGADADKNHHEADANDDDAHEDGNIFGDNGAIRNGSWGGEPNGKSFRFVRACGQAGKAKLRVRVRGDLVQ